MIICRKCQRHHADDVGAGPCPCGADLRRDGIALVQGAGVSPFDDGGLDELPPLGEELPALDDTQASQSSPSSEAPTATPPAPPSPTPTGGADSTPAGASSEATDDSASALKGRGRRARSVKPRMAPSAPSPSTAPPPDVATPDVAPDVPAGEPMPEPSRRARGVNPKDLLAARADANAPNVGEAPPPGAGSGAAAGPGATATTEMEPTPPPPKAGERACPECFEPNAETRHFCINCGTTLPAVEEPEGDEDAEEGADAPKRGLLQRFKRGGRGRGAPGGGGMGGRAKGRAQHQAKRRARGALPQGMQRHGQMAGSWGQRARAMGGGGRMKYTSGLSTKSKLKAGAGILVVLVALVALAGPGRGKVMALVGRGDPEGVSPAQAELFGRQAPPSEDEGAERGEETGGNEGQLPDDEGADGEESEDEAPGGRGEIAAFPASAAIDEDGETGAGMPWALDLEEPQSAGLILTLEEPMEVSRILIAAGLPDSVEDGPLVLRPSRVRVCSDTETCAEVELGDSTSLQKQTLDLGEDVTTLILTILDVHVPEHTTYDMAVISEIRVAD